MTTNALRKELQEYQARRRAFLKDGAFFDFNLLPLKIQNISQPHYFSH